MRHPQALTPSKRWLRIDFAPLFSPVSRLPLDSQIPLYTSDGKLVSRIPSDRIPALRYQVRTVRNRRGNLQRVILRDISEHDVRKYQQRTGLHFEQQLCAGRVHALHGVRGSR